MDRTSCPLGSLWVALAIGMAVAGPAGAATIHLISTGPAGIVIDAMSSSLLPRATTARRPSVRIYRGALLRQAVGIGTAGRCLAAGGATFAVLGAVSGAQVALGQCVVAAVPRAVAAADGAPAAEPAIARFPANRAKGAAPAKGDRIQIAMQFLLPPAAAAGVPVGPILAEGLGDPTFGGSGPSTGMPPAAPVPIPAPGAGLLTALGLLVGARLRPV